MVSMYMQNIKSDYNKFMPRKLYVLNGTLFLAGCLMVM